MIGLVGFGGLGVVDVGGSHLSAARVLEGVGAPSLGRRVRAELDAGADRNTLLSALTSPLVALRAEAWVFALPGPFDYAAGRGDFDGVGKFGALAGVDLGVELAARLGVAQERVTFVNDAQAYGLGEWWGTSLRRNRSVCLTLGTGVGSVFLVDGLPVESGPGVPPHGWVHLLRLDGSTLEDRVSTRALRTAYAGRTGRLLDVREVAAAARSGDGTARDVLETAMRNLARATSASLRDFGADELVVGGSVALAWDLLEEPLRGALTSQPELAGLDVRASALRDDAPLFGAAWWIRQVGRPASPAPTP